MARRSGCRGTTVASVRDPEPQVAGYNTPTVAHGYRERRNMGAEPAGAYDDVRFRRFWDDDDPSGSHGGECVPAMDVIETAEGIEILMDLPGVSASGIRLFFSQGTVVIAGEKRPAACAHREAAFHLAERGFGRFARAVRLNGAFDAGRATATLTDGELRIVLPRIEERRGRDMRIEIRES
jgi:HSP20 family protein